MASLTAHLRRSEDHGCLPFHPGCPICRDERLSGTLAIHGLVSRRTQAVMAAGVLAAATATPTVAIAQEADQVTEGALAPEQSGADPGVAPDFDPGGESADLPFAGPESPEIEPEPVTDVDAPIADSGDEAEPTAPASPVPTTPAPTLTPTPTVTPPATAAPTPTVAPPTTAAPPRVVVEPSERGRAAAGPDFESEVTSNRKPSPRPRTTAPTASVSQPAVVQMVKAVAPPPKAPSTPHEAARSGDRYHVVVAGESLWSISRDALGGSASPAGIAREVNRLWALNSARIATGDPDLLRVGTTLLLR
jgi:hypothetical protein